MWTMQSLSNHPHLLFNSVLTFTLFLEKHSFDFPLI